MTEFFKNKLPFKVVSSSVNSGYVTQISAGYKPGIEIINLHRDTYGELEGTPTQGPFTSEHIGGYQFRHVPFNTGSDNDFNRPEYFKINPTASSLRVYGPDYESVHKPRGQMWKGAKSPFNIENIRSTERVVGNFEKNYQVVQTSGRNISNSLIVDGYTASAELTTQFITGVNNYSLPNLLTSSKSIIVERFNAPGGKEESSRGALDRNGEELSPNNSLITRNIKVRQPFYKQLTQHAYQFNTNNTIHAVNRNTFKNTYITSSITTEGVYSETEELFENKLFTGSLSSGSFSNFGNPVCLNSQGNLMAVGASNIGINYGVVYIYRYENSDWIEEFVTPDIGDGLFSLSFNNEGNMLAIGESALEQVYVYNSSSIGWSLIQTITSSLANSGAAFGYAVSFNSSSNVIAVGAPNYLSVDIPGAVCIFRSASLGWFEESLIECPLTTNEETSYFGVSVSLNNNGNILAVAAQNEEYDPENPVDDWYDYGVVIVYESGSVGWSNVAYLTGNYANPFTYDSGQYLNVSLNGEGNILAAGWPFVNVGGDERLGEVCVFTSGNLGWNRTTITGSYSDDYDFFGISVSLNQQGDVLAVGAYLDETPYVNSGTGIVYLFKSSSIGWTEQQILTGSLEIDPSSPQYPQTHFGISVSLNSDGKILAVGSPYNNLESYEYTSGVSYVFKPSIFSGTLYTVNIENKYGYDNFWNQHNLPATDYGYAWIKQISIKYPEIFSTFSEQEALNYILQYQYSSSTPQIELTNSIGTSGEIDIDLQKLIGSLSGSERFYSSWRQTRTNEHPVSRKLKELNLISVLDEPKTIIQKNGKQVKSIKTNLSKNFKEPLVTNKFYPLEQEVTFDEDEIGEQPTKLIYSDRNSTSYFANDSLNERLNIQTNNNLPTSEFYNIVLNSVKYSVDSPIEEIISVKFKENVYPKALNTYLSGTRVRTEYFIDKSGFDRDGYDRQLGTQRVFWRDIQEKRRRSLNSDGGYINSLGYSSLQESGSDFNKVEDGLLFNNEYIIVTSSYIRNVSNLDKGINNSIILLEQSSSNRQLYSYSASYLIQGTYEGDLFYKISSNLSRRGIIQDIAGEFNCAFSDFYEQFVKNEQKQSIGSIYRNTDFKKYITSLSNNRDNLLDITSQTDDEQFITNPRPRYITFIGGGELNTGSLFDNLSNFDNSIDNIYYNIFNSSINSIVKFGTKIIFAGNFNGVYENKSYNKILSLDTATNSLDNFSSGLNGNVYALAVSGTDLYVGGEFTVAGLHTPAYRIARFNLSTNTWSSLDYGVNSNVRSIVVSGSDLYVGGDFSTGSTSAITLNKIARWNTITNTWSSLGISASNGLSTYPTSTTVNSIVVVGPELYVVGSFSTAGGLSANNIARWNTSTNTWSSLGSGPSNGLGGFGSEVYSIAVSGTDLYPVGYFYSAGGTTVYGIARWSITASNWSPVNISFNGTPYYNTILQDNMYIGGYFSNVFVAPSTTVSANRIVRYNLTTGDCFTLGEVGAGFNALVKTINASEPEIYIGGDFTATNFGLITKYAAKYNINKNLIENLNFNSNFNNFNYNLLTESFNYNDIKFSTLDNGLIRQNNNISFYDSLEDYSKNDIYQIAKEYTVVPEFKISENLKYYIKNGGNFKTLNNSFLTLDGAATNYSSAVTETSSLKREFFEKYSFTDIINKNRIESDYSDSIKQNTISINVKGVKKLLPYNGFYPQDRTIQLSNLYNEYVNSVLSGGLYSLENVNLFNNDLIISGTSNEIKSVQNLSVENYNNKFALLKNTINLGDVDGNVYAFAVSGSDIYVGGRFSTAGGITVNNIARWNTIERRWYGLGSGTSGPVYAIAFYGNDIYVGGAFALAGGVSRSRIARWNNISNSWSALSYPPFSNGVTATVRALTVSGSDLYVGGEFTRVGSPTTGLVVNRIARWNAATYTWGAALGSGLVNNEVSQIAVSGSDLYVVGSFFYYNGDGTFNSRGIAKWDTVSNTWSKVGGSVQPDIKAIAVSGTDIYVGGSISNANGVPVNTVARWSTTASVWSSLGVGIGGVPFPNVYSIAVSGTDIYFGGYFSTAGGSTANNIALWNTISNTWSSVGNGIQGGSENYVSQLLNYNGDIYIGSANTTFALSTSPPRLTIKQPLNPNIITTGLVRNIAILYTSSNSSYKQFDQAPAKIFENIYYNPKLVATPSGLNLFCFKEEVSNIGNRKFVNLKTNNFTDWSSETILITSSYYDDYFGEYWDYVYSPENNKFIFAISSPFEQTGSKSSAGVVRVITSSLSTDFLGNNVFINSSPTIIGTGSNADNAFGTGLSLISCSNGYQLFIGESLGDTTSVNYGNIWVSTSSNGQNWSVPISIISGSTLSSSIGYNNIKAVNYTHNNISRTYVFFTEPFSKPESENDYLNGKLFVISSSINNNWGNFNINSEKTPIYNIGIATTISGTLLDVSGGNKNSIEVYADEDKITYCFVNSIDDSEEEFSEIRIGSSYDGINWQKQDEMFKQQNIGINGGETLAKIAYNSNFNIKLPIFFTNINFSYLDDIYYFENNKFTRYSLNVSGTEKFIKQAALEPIAAPGILYNSIKSGIAVDWPCATGSQISLQPYGSGTIVNAYYPQSFKMASHQGNNINELNIYGNLRSNIDYRVNFEKLIFPDDIFITKKPITSSLEQFTLLSELDSNSEIVKNINGTYIYGGYEPYTSPVDFSDFNQLGPKRFSIPFIYRKEEAKDTGLYSMAMSNFLAETVKFFLKDGLLSSFQSNPDSQWGIFENSKTYYMDVIISKTPELIMMEAYHSDKHPIGPNGEKMNGRYFGYPVNKTNKKLWSQDSDTLFTDEEARLMHNDPAYAPYTPPYLEGQAIARLSFSPSSSKNYTIDEIFSQIVVENIFPAVERGAHTGSDAFINKMPVASSINYKGKLPWVDVTRGTQNNETTNNSINSWIIGTRFETPVLDFSSQSLTPYEDNVIKSSGFGRGMWSGYGQIPTDQKGIYVSLKESYPQEYSLNSQKQSLLQKVGFTQNDKKIGLLGDKKTIKEAVMIIPFIEKLSTNNFRTYSYNNVARGDTRRRGSFLTSIEKELGIEFIGVRRDIYKQVVDGNIQSSILDTYNRMKEFVVPPLLDYVKDSKIDPYVAYVVDFSHDLSQQDLADIWQGVAPQISRVAELDQQSITHENKLTEFFHGEGMPNDVRFMVFKIKQKGEFNYFKITKDSTDDLNFKFEQKIGRSIDDYSYNWPYDFYSLVELAKVDVEIEYKKKEDVAQDTTEPVTVPIVTPTRGGNI